MAQSNKKTISLYQSNKKIRKNLDLLQQGLDDLYQDTYYTNNDNAKQADAIRDRINQSLGNIMSNNYTNDTIGGISRVYTRMQLQKANNDKDLVNAMSVFDDQVIMDQVLSTYMQNKWLKDLDYEIDTVLKYMPKLKEALNVKKDAVLSADHFGKDFVGYFSSVDQTHSEKFSARMEEIKKVYNLPMEFDRFYDDAQTYGEEFIYIVPYNRELEKLLANRPNTAYTGGVFTESITESALDDSMKLAIDAYKKEFNIDEDVKINLTVEFNKTGRIRSIYESYAKAQKINESNNIHSMSETFQSFLESTILEKKDEFKLADKLIPDELSIPDELEDRSVSRDGLFSKNGTNSSDTKIKVPGCIVKRLDRTNIIPIYIDEICMGYYYIEFKSGNDLSFQDPNYTEYAAGLNTLGSYSQMNRNMDRFNSQNREKIIGYLSKRISDTIDAKFINANQDLRKEIYMILKHNDVFNSKGTSIDGNMCITFIPPEDVVHMVFNRDDITHRGISDLKYSLFPAKLYSCLYITNTLGILTRGQDKRVYYVKQNVDTNIASTMLNVLNQIKKGNFGARQMESLGTVLNITGRFNDYIIPVSQNGDSPIQFDIMEGQKFDYPSELMDKLEEMAVNPTDIPLEAINARQTLEYAIQATMSNSKLMRTVYKRQELVETYLTQITQKIYLYEYGEEEDFEIDLPTPSFINMSNGAQLINGTIQYAQSVADLLMKDKSDEVKNEFVKLFCKHHLANHMDSILIDKCIKQAEINIASATTRDSQEEQ